MSLRKTRKKRRPAKSPSRRKAAPASEPLSARDARRERRRELSREEIVEAARRVLLRDGLAKATLDAVASEVGLTKAAIYYYFPSKEALFFELIYRVIEAQYHAVHDRVQEAKDGSEALGAIIRTTIETFAPRLDDFRLAFLHGQVAGPGVFKASADQLARIRPLNDLAFADTAKLLTAERPSRAGESRVDPRLMAFLASASAIGLLTMKGMVESIDDPLLYSDEQLIDGLSRIFAAAVKG